MNRSKKPPSSASQSRGSAAAGSSTRQARLAELTALCERGVERCRAGQWQEGLADLAWLADGKSVRSGMPSVAYSYLGYGLARYKNKVKEGLRLCRYALKLEFYQTENYVNLTRTCMLSASHRREAFESVREGLKIDPDHPELRQLHRQLGQRRPPVLRFLSRQHPVNRFLGSFRHAFRKSPKTPAADDDLEEKDPSSGRPATTVSTL